MSKLSIVFTDFDGTLTVSGTDIGEHNTAALHELGERNITRVIATGRNLYSAKRALPPDFPLDFLIFSSGAGILNWHNDTIINSNHIEKAQTGRIRKYLEGRRFNFMMHLPIPDNHHFYYHQGTKEVPDFFRRIEHYKDFAKPLTDTSKIDLVSQFIAVFPESDTHEFTKVSEVLEEVHIIRSTSPIDKASLWMEIFPSGVSKGFAAKWLCNYLGIPEEESFGIGNDYNDIELLEWCAESYVVADAPELLKQLFPIAESNNNHAFAKIIEKALARRGGP